MSSSRKRDNDISVKILHVPFEKFLFDISNSSFRNVDDIIVCEDDCVVLYGTDEKKIDQEGFVTVDETVFRQLLDEEPPVFLGDDLSFLGIRVDDLVVLPSLDIKDVDFDGNSRTVQHPG